MNALATPNLSISALENMEIDARSFDHESHIYLAWLYLCEYGPAEAIQRFNGALQRLTAHLGVPDKYHVTITWMFLLIIEERRTAGPQDDWFAFRRNNDDLFTGGIDVMLRFYSKELLWSDRARKAFVLPDRLAA
jgi:hypothetical protein